MNKENFDISKVDFIQIGEGPDLVLLHSLLSDRTVFEFVLDELSTFLILSINQSFIGIVQCALKH